MRQESIIVPKVWRSELRLLSLFFVLSVVSIFLSNEFPHSVIIGELFRFGRTRIMLHLPLFWFLPAAALGKAMWRVYNVRYVLDANGIEYRRGIISIKQIVTRIRYVDIRSAEIVQNLTERVLSVGTVLISTAATMGVEVLFAGVAVPQEVQEVILAERDKRQRLEAIHLKRGHEVEKKETVHA